jgi:hypothetical protein
MNKEIIFLGDLNTDYLKHVPTSWETILTTHAGLSFEAGCRRNSTSTLYSAAGYFLCIKDKKCIIP